MKKEYYAKVIFDGSEDWKTCDNANENKDMESIFEKTLIADLDKVRYWLQYYIDRTKELKNEAEYYRNAYENRVNECLRKED